MTRYGIIVPHGVEGHDAALYANYTMGDSPEKSIRAMFPTWPVNTRGKKEMTINSWLEFRAALDDILEMYLILEQGDGTESTASEYVITADFLDDLYLPWTLKHLN